jgi:methionyl aminopeptidase
MFYGLPDGWTAVTRDGKRLSQFEDTMVVTETGVEILTARADQPLNKLEWRREIFQR